MTTISFKNVYINSFFTTVGKVEYEGPLKSYFDAHFSDPYLRQKSFELAEMEMIRYTIHGLLKKDKTKEKDIKVCFGGDLSNQIACSNHALKEFCFPFVGLYGACSTSMLSLGIASMYVDKYKGKAIAYSASFNQTSEKQFRYPNEYGVQKKPCSTYTASGCGACLISNKKTKIRVKRFTIGRIIDSYQSDVSDLGGAMSLAALDTLKKHLLNTATCTKDYDLILTGDLSKEGSKILKSIAIYEDIYLKDNYNDCGLLLYDLESQDVYAGGSGCACCAVVTYSYVMSLFKEEKINNCLIIATGALFSPSSFSQEKTIPTIAHAIELERVEL